MKLMRIPRPRDRLGYCRGTMSISITVRSCRIGRLEDISRRILSAESRTRVTFRSALNSEPIIIFNDRCGNKYHFKLNVIRLCPVKLITRQLSDDVCHVQVDHK
ncbi:hypothetical protein PUN28_015318 [Cardiocondyla obscurior]|uniref:Uncharacterized protein n=1 Tax=Cardiocondyla obscurior TaxID=286306 RepID=A0AAW2ESC9_9HYME